MTRAAPVHAPRRRRGLGVLVVALLAGLLAACQPVPPPGFTARVFALDAELRSFMTGRSWRPGCPVGLDDLRLLVVTHWGFDGRTHDGELVVHEDWAQPVAAAFAKLYDARFPIQRMRLVDHYGADDDASMAANNTSAFNCRAVTGGSSWSPHSYGTAIDINPVQNPYVRGSTVLPPAGAPYAHDRDGSVQGLITAGGPVPHAFGALGWQWGGTWTNPTDYQHVDLPGRLGPAPALGVPHVGVGASVATNHDGRSEIVTVSAGRRLVHAWEDGGGWSAVWELDGGSVESTPAVVANADGRLEVFAVGADGVLRHTWQVCPGCGWSGLHPLGGSWPRTSGVAAALAHSGRLEAFVIGADGAVHRLRQQPSGAWSAPVSLGGGVVGTPAAARNADGRLELYATTADGWLVHAWEQAPGGPWSGWAPFAAGVAGSPALTANADGRLEVAALAAGSRELVHAWQQGGGGWSALVPLLPGAWRGDPGLGRDDSGVLVVAVEGDDRQLHTARQTCPGCGWTGSQAIPSAAGPLA
jgi:hypothetical protein